jgi:DHA2 family multidrug resistance protein
MITGFAVISGIAFLALIPWELVQQHPVINLRLYANRNFAISSLLMLVTGAVVFGSTQFIPQLLQNVMGYTAELAGMALTMGGLVAFVIMPLAGVLTNRFDARYLVGVALLIQAFALWHMTTLNAQISFWDAAWVRLYQAVGLPLLFIPITNSAYVGLRPEDSDQASGLLNVARNLGGTIGISMVQTMLARSEQFHLDRLVEYLNPLDSNYRIALDRLTQELASRGMSQVEAGRAAVAMLYQQTQTQAQMLSFLDIFNVFTILVLLTIPLVFLMRKPQGGAPAAA